MPIKMSKKGGGTKKRSFDEGVVMLRRMLMLQKRLIHSRNISENTSNLINKEYEEGAAGTNKNRQSDPLTEYSDKEPMTPAKINAGEPTAVKRDPNDQQITSEGQTGTNTQEAQEEYRKRGMTKVDSDNHSHEGSSCSCGH